jgi:Tol biopolymer transport system component
MGIQIGQQLGSLEITALLGKGGMGEVYRARDKKLKRDVAVKILPDEFARDADRVGRFQREAEVLASLNHPNIASIYDLEEAQGARFLVLELVEGETLADRIARGPIPVKEALTIGKDICEALEAAHEKGVAHRDLKPANIKLTASGQVKVLDFGLAKVLEHPSGNTVLSNSPTLRETSAGVIFGTAAYMSPEQAKGVAADARSDVFSFGCVLYEMLTGRPAFVGDTVSEILASVLLRDPQLDRLPSDLNPRIPELLRRCLDKNPKRRWQAVGDLKTELETVAADVYRKVNGSGRTAMRLRERTVWIAVVLLLTGLAAVLGNLAFRSSPAAPEMRVEIATPPATSSTSFAISPDGRNIVYEAAPEGRSTLWLRALDSTTPRALPGTEYPTFPFWSPDGKSIGFFADGKLKRIDIAGGGVRTLANCGACVGGTWNRDGMILFRVGGSNAIFKVPASGGEAVLALKANASFPQFLPDGQHFLYSLGGGAERRGAYVGQLDGTGTSRIIDTDPTPAVYAPPQLLFIRQGTLFAQAFDIQRLALAGEAIPIADRVSVVSASAAGPIAYRIGSTNTQTQFVWFDGSGKENERIGGRDNTSNPSLSPDGRYVAVQRSVNGNTDIWLLELARGVLSRFTFDPASEQRPLWSPDGARLVFNSDRKGVYDLYLKSATGTGTEELLLATPQPKTPLDWSRDGRFILYRVNDPKTGYDIWALPIEGDRKPIPLLHTNFDEREAQFSPDGKWIAYQSNESGRFEIYVQPFPGLGRKWQISTDGGAQVRWRGDGKELFYIGLDDRLMAFPIRLSSDGQSVESGTPVPLFVTHIGGALPGTNRQQYMVSPNGQRFLMQVLTTEADTSPITLILNRKLPR